jgi:DNA-binding NarL/FixJ family response regulator
MVAERHAPAHNLLVGPLDSWHREPMYRQLMLPRGLEHVMMAPVVGEGKIVATLHFVREKDHQPFGAGELVLASAMANHVSALLARCDPDAEELPLLTRREREVARLVAAGFNNPEIAGHLGISRNTVKEILKRTFRKLGVDARAEMAARLTAARVL